MSKLVCAIRGGEGSRRAQDEAIRLAKQRGDGIIFVHVVDADLISRVGDAIADTVANELEHLGGALLSIAAERAAAQDVAAETCILRGPVAQTLEDVVRQCNAKILVMGAHHSDMRPYAFSDTALNQFANHLRSALGIEVIVV